MKYSSTYYAKAFVGALMAQTSKETDCVQNLLGLLTRTGDIRRSSVVLHAITQELVRQKGGRVVEMETARELSEKREKQVRDMFLKKDYVERRIRPELLAGIRLVVNRERELDRSLKRTLQTFRK